MLKYVVFRLGSLVLPRLPAGVYYPAAALLGDLAYLLAPAARRRVADNLRHVLGRDAAQGGLRRAVRGVFRNAAKNYCELLALSRLGPQIERAQTVTGWEHLLELREQGKGIIVVTAHLGNVDLAVQVLAARSVEIIVLVEPLRPPFLFELVKALRESQGVSFLPVSVASMKIALRALRQGGVVAVAGDRDVLGKGVRMNFFDEDTLLPVGAVDLALKTGAAILPAFSVRLADGRFEIRVEPPIMVEASRGGNGVREASERVIAYIEKHVRDNPEQWVVFERVWEGDKLA